jgi:hypothetical protein
MWTLFALVHGGAGALWLGAMTYSLVVVQPRLGRLLGGDVHRIEDAHRELAHGNRWPVIGIIALLWVSGLVLMLRGGSGLWWLAVAFKALLLLGASGLFWWVSWRAWPRRVFALPAELPALQRRFRLAALLMLTLVAVAYAVGVVGQAAR